MSDLDPNNMDQDGWLKQITQQFLKGGIFGIVVFVGFLAFFLAPYWVGRVYPVETQQSGPRGISMGLVDFAADRTSIEEQTADYYSDEPYEVTEGEETAGEFYENVQVLGDLSIDNFNRVMNAITLWVSPEQGCAYCHGEDGNFAHDDLYTKVVSRRMIQMTQFLNDDYAGHVAPAGVNCYTCHRGQNVPEYIWFTPEPSNEWVEGWAAYQNNVQPLTYWTDLPVDAIQKYLLEGEQIGVHAYAPREPNEGTARIQNAERTFSLMNHFSNSLGVNCTFCHNSRAFAEADQFTPQWATASLGILMLLDTNNEYLDPLQPEYPDHRLGPLGDAPKAMCSTCHQGLYQPMLGADMISDWPELAAPGAPVYD